MKGKKVYISPVVQGVHVLQSVGVQRSPPLKNHEVKGNSEKEGDEEKRKAELKAREDEAYKNGKLDAEKSFALELAEIKNRNASLVTMLQDAAEHFREKREKIWEEGESEIVKIILTIANKIVGYEINNKSIMVAQHVLKEALSYAKENKIIAVRLSCDDAKKMNELEGIKTADRSIKFIEDKTISPGGCVIDTNFGSIDSQIESRWEEMIKALSENTNDKTVH